MVVPYQVSEHDLRHGLVVPPRHLHQRGVVDPGGARPRAALQQRAEWRVGRHHDAPGGAVGAERLLLQVQVHLECEGFDEGE